MEQEPPSTLTLPCHHPAQILTHTLGHAAGHRPPSRGRGREGSRRGFYCSAMCRRDSGDRGQTPLSPTLTPIPQHSLLTHPWVQGCRVVLWHPTHIAAGGSSWGQPEFPPRALGTQVGQCHRANTHEVPYTHPAWCASHQQVPAGARINHQLIPAGMASGTASGMASLLSALGLAPWWEPHRTPPAMGHTACGSAGSDTHGQEPRAPQPWL